MNWLKVVMAGWQPASWRWPTNSNPASSNHPIGAHSSNAEYENQVHRLAEPAARLQGDRFELNHRLICLLPEKPGLQTSAFAAYFLKASAA